jgi:bifunctional ADP-heptose synthase (sugar kinase/adenylyltransferase)
VCGLALASGASYEDAAVLANLAAGLVGDEVGTVAVARQRLRQLLTEKQL